MADCTPDYPVMGMQAGEELATMLRLVALFISIAVTFPWLSSQRRGRMRIFFLHWISGVMYVMSQFIMSVMVLNCWSSRHTSGPFIYLLKFWELGALNLWSISSLAIAVLIASIAQSFATMRRVPPMIGNATVAWACVVAAIMLTVTSAVFWNGILVTGGYFWVTNTDNVNVSKWISLSFGATQTIAGLLMAVAVAFTLTGERLRSLKVCCNTCARVKSHFVLTIFGTLVYVYNGVVLLVDNFSDMQISPRLVVIGWCSRYVHVVADTGIIFMAFYGFEKSEWGEMSRARQDNHVHQISGSSLGVLERGVRSSSDVTTPLANSRGGITAATKERGLKGTSVIVAPRPSAAASSSHTVSTTSMSRHYSCRSSSVEGFSSTNGEDRVEGVRISSGPFFQRKNSFGGTSSASSSKSSSRKSNSRL